MHSNVVVCIQKLETMEVPQQHLRAYIQLDISPSHCYLKMFFYFCVFFINAFEVILLFKEAFARPKICDIYWVNFRKCRFQ